MKKFNKRALAMLGCLVLMLSLAVPAFAQSTSSIETAVTGALTTVQSDAMSMIAAVLPYALAIMGAIVVITIGIRAFKRTSK